MPSILIVDDSASHCLSVAKILQRHGFEVLRAKDAEQGLATAIERQPDVILMDVVMPGVNGFEATRLLKSNELTKNIPVALLSAKQGAADKQWGLRQGAAGYLVKPVQEKLLLGMLQSLLKG